MVREEYTEKYGPLFAKHMQSIEMAYEQDVDNNDLNITFGSAYQYYHLLLVLATHYDQIFAIRLFLPADPEEWYDNLEEHCSNCAERIHTLLCNTDGILDLTGTSHKQRFRSKYEENVLQLLNDDTEQGNKILHLVLGINDKINDLTDKEYLQYIRFALKNIWDELKGILQDIEDIRNNNEPVLRTSINLLSLRTEAEGQCSLMLSSQRNAYCFERGIVQNRMSTVDHIQVYEKCQAIVRGQIKDSPHYQTIVDCMQGDSTKINEALLVNKMHLRPDWKEVMTMVIQYNWYQSQIDSPPETFETGPEISDDDREKFALLEQVFRSKIICSSEGTKPTRQGVENLSNTITRCFGQLGKNIIDLSNQKYGDLICLFAALKARRWLVDAVEVELFVRSIAMLYPKLLEQGRTVKNFVDAINNINRKPSRLKINSIGDQSDMRGYFEERYRSQKTRSERFYKIAENCFYVLGGNSDLEK